MRTTAVRGFFWLKEIVSLNKGVANFYQEGMEKRNPEKVIQLASRFLLTSSKGHLLLIAAGVV